MYTARVTVLAKPDVNNPEGKVVADALRKLGFDGVAYARAGKHFEIGVEADSPEKARAAVERMCSQLLAHPLMEDYEVRVSG